MKLFVAVVAIFIVGPSVFARESVSPPAAPSGFGLAPFGDSPMGKVEIWVYAPWIKQALKGQQVSLTSQEKANTQEPDKYAKNVPLPNTQQDTRPDQYSGQQIEGKQGPQSPGDALIWNRIINWFSNVMNALLAVGFATVIAAAKLYIDWRKERPHLVAHWDMEPVREDRSARASVTIENIGVLPAKLHARALYCELLPHVPARFDYAPTLKSIKNKELPKGGKLSWTFRTRHIGTLEMSRMQGRRGEFLLLYAAAHVEIKSLLWTKRSFTFEAVYDMTDQQLRPVTDLDHRYEYNKE